MKVKLLFFASLREQLGRAQEEVELPGAIHTVGALREHLRRRGGEWASVFAPNDQIVLVAVASAHRADAFAACAFIMDYLKTQAPFWKKEHRAGGAAWVEARAADDEAAERWKRERS